MRVAAVSHLTFTCFARCRGASSLDGGLGQPLLHVVFVDLVEPVHHTVRALGGQPGVEMGPNFLRNFIIKVFLLSK